MDNFTLYMTILSKKGFVCLRHQAVARHGCTTPVMMQLIHWQCYNCVIHVYTSREQEKDSSTAVLTATDIDTSNSPSVRVVRTITTKLSVSRFLFERTIQNLNVMKKEYTRYVLSIFDHNIL